MSAFAERRAAQASRSTGLRLRCAPMTFATDPRIDAYIDSLPEWQQAICGEVRALVHAADPDVVETIKRTKLP